jgi:DNA polymerase-4
VTRQIIHIDLDAFFCSVEEQQNPKLIGLPFAVGGRPEERGVVSSCSYPARQQGIRSAMPMARALRLCPRLIVLPARHHLYWQISQQVMIRLREWTPLMEQISVDEAFLDMSDLPDSPAEIARKIQSSIRDDLGLPCSLGVATNKLVAKIATDVGKAAHRGIGPPNAITVVPPGEEAAFLAPLPTIALWGIGPKTAARLAENSVHTIGELAARSESEIVQLFGKHGRDMIRRAHGIDDSPIIVEHEAKSISQEVTFARDVRDGEALRRTLQAMSEQVGKRLRIAHLCGKTVKLKLRWPDFNTLTRQTTLSQPTDQDDDISQAVRLLFDNVWQPGKAVRLIGVGVSGLGAPARQLSLWETESGKSRRLQAAMDTLRGRYGDQAVRRGKS